MKRTNTLLLILSVVTRLSFGQTIVSGMATNVYDGDTFTLNQSDGTKLKIRVSGIDAPEINQDHGVESRDFAKEILEGKEVTVYLEPGETYGRKLGFVITKEGKHFNYEMVANGMAWWYDYYSTDRFLSAAQKAAQEQKIGIWTDSNPIAPWDWRKSNK